MAKAVVAPLSATIFTVTSADLARLGPGDAVEVVQELLWAEARRLGVPTTRVHISRLVNVADGGIDASIDTDNVVAGSELIVLGKTGFQIKAGGAFEPWKKSHIQKELFDTRLPRIENLGDMFRPRSFQTNGSGNERVPPWVIQAAGWAAA